MTFEYDVAIVGAGDVGAAVARELARFNLRIVLLDSGDVGAGTSKANTAILHTGFDAKPGTAEAKLVTRGHGLLLAYAAEVGIPIERTGALLVAWTPEEVERLPEIEANARACGYGRVRKVSAHELYGREPNLGGGALAGLEVPDEFIVCPFTPPLAFATQAALAGVDVRRWEPVLGLDRLGEGWRLTTADGSVTCRFLVNAAGLRSDEVHRMAGLDGFTVTPRKGELIVFDKLARGLLSHIILPVPTATTKGVLIAPTVFGNVMVGPTAQDIHDKTDTSSTTAGLESLRSAGERIMPELDNYEVTATYVGLRAATEHKDYQLQVHGDRSYVCAAGIRSTGLTASMAIAEWVRDALDGAGLPLNERPTGLPSVQMPNIGEAAPRPYAEREAIEADSAYGEIICFCERVTRGEIRDAARSTLPPEDLDGLRRRTRVLMGRCQGFFCGANIVGSFAEHSGMDPARLWELRP